MPITKSEIEILITSGADKAVSCIGESYGPIVSYLGQRFSDFSDPRLHSGHIKDLLSLPLINNFERIIRKWGT